MNSARLLKPLTEYARSRNLTREKILKFAEYHGFQIDGTQSKSKLLGAIQNLLDARQSDPHLIADNFAKALYLDDITYHPLSLPSSIREKTESYLGREIDALK